ncbi:N-acyl-L-amino acid amidohydrolase [Janibacter indicus]|uniref:N-acyl-L-amino acid amidohydrolase n=1 Tax=Janibacter indicus TaxID=857417 RepID=A0A1L3MI25_9MICO|nr:amidohydrolase [Janibacter indicus]APH02083.1 N-acyl-L-amino acid amidohydrolase [Janibacter indicus]
MTAPLAPTLLRVVDRLVPELIDFRRDLHRHPEISFQEHRTTARLRERLEAAGLEPRSVSETGLVVDLGAAEPRRRVALRGDIDALPVRERTGLDWSSTVDGVCHACGHDVHTTALLGAGLALAEVADELAVRHVGVRLVFQPAEEQMPGGALTFVQSGVMQGVDTVYAVHCDPSLDVGEIGLREGPLTAAADQVTVTLRGRGGHTSRPFLTEDLTYALGKVVTDVPAVLSRRVDPRAGLVVVWGRVSAGEAINVIPSTGVAQGTLRMLDVGLWEEIGPLLHEVVADVVRPYGVTAAVDHIRGVPPVVNDSAAVAALGRATMAAGLRPVPTPHSLGGEDFAWMLHEAEGAMARLGTRTHGGRTFDLHQGDLVVDEGAVRGGTALLTLAAAGEWTRVEDA